MNNPIKNIIFDFGGVILNVNPMAFATGLTELGCKDMEGLHNRFIKDNVYMRFEKGQMSPATFRAELKSALNNHVTDIQIDWAWNLILGNFTQEPIRFLTEIKRQFRTFLLSNTNSIHYDCFQTEFRKKFNSNSMDELFEKAYYSFQMNLYKPEPEIFEYVINDSRLNPEETLFVDDNILNIESASQCGLQTLHYVENAGSALGKTVLDRVRRT